MLMASITKSNLLPLIITHLKNPSFFFLSYLQTTPKQQVSYSLSCSLRNLSMPYMELKSTFTSCFVLLLLLSLPYFSIGESKALESEIYEIDYRGPETHSSSPPPDHHHHQSHATPLSKHRKASLGNSATVNKGPKSSNNHPKQEKVERIHG